MVLMSMHNTVEIQWLEHLWAMEICSRHTVFNQFTTHAPTVKQFHSLQITACVFFVYFFIKTYVVGSNLNCINLSMQFK